MGEIAAWVSAIVTAVGLPDPNTHSSSSSSSTKGSSSTSSDDDWSPEED